MQLVNIIIIVSTAIIIRTSGEGMKPLKYREQLCTTFACAFPLFLPPPLYLYPTPFLQNKSKAPATLLTWCTSGETKLLFAHN